MNEFQSKLFEKYKELDKVCKEMFSCENGVSTYIEKMEKNWIYAYRITNWSYDYKMLKRVRWIRNKIAHDTDVPEVEEEDIEFIEDFQQRIVHLEDPLMLAAKLKQKQQESQKQNNSNSKQECNIEKNSTKNDSRFKEIDYNAIDGKDGINPAVFFLMLFIIVFIIVFAIMYFF